MDSSHAPLINSFVELHRALKYFLQQSTPSKVALTDSEIALLKSVAQDANKQTTQTELARKLTLSESTLCTLVEKLRKGGLVIRERLVTDRRKTRIVLTETGRKRLLEIAFHESELEDRLKIASEDRSELLKLCQNASLLLNRFSKETDGSHEQSSRAGRAA